MQEWTYQYRHSRQSGKISLLQGARVVDTDPTHHAKVAALILAISRFGNHI